MIGRRIGTDEGERRRGVFQGAVWVALSRLIVRSLGLVSTLVLARLLTPEDFGLVAIAMSVVAMLRAFSEFGFNEALIHYKEPTDADYATAWTLNGLRGVALALILLGAAYPVSVSLGEPALLHVFPFIALAPIFEGLQNPRIISFEKSLKFDVLFRLMVASKVAGVVVAIAGALMWQSYWALLAGLVVTAFTRTALSFLVVRGSARPAISSFRKLFRFSGWLSGAEMLNALGIRMNPILLALFVPTSTVGVFHMARELHWTMFNEVSAPLRRVLFPALSRHEIGSPAFDSLYRQALCGLLMVAGPVSLGFALVVSDFVPLVLGAQWDEVVKPIQWVSPALVLSVLGQPAQAAAMSAGRTRLLFYRNCIGVPVRLVLFVSGAALHGLDGAVIGLVAGMLVNTGMNVYIGKAVTGIGLVRHLLMPYRSWLALGAMSAAVLAVAGVPFGEGEVAHFLRLCTKVGVGGLTFVGAHLWLWALAGRPEGPERTLLDATKTTVGRLRSAGSA